MTRPYHHLNVYYGDIHNHCNLSYGKGTLQEALHNARLQLDFVSVTLHGHWEDLPTDDPSLDYLVEYHRVGFEKAAQAWQGYVHAIDAANQDGTFVTFPSFEWHSMQYGDHCVYFRDHAPDAIYQIKDIDDLRQHLQQHDSPAFMIPHHIGYKRGFRGINWDAFTSKYSPVVEIMSFHGASEHSAAQPAYLHAMGPRDERSTVQYALAQGHMFGFVGSTDHHSAHPGTYGYGKMGVWAEALTRESLWQAIAARRTYAVSGDRIRLAVALNEQPMGAQIAYTPDRKFSVTVEAGDAIDYIEVLHNNRVIHRETVYQTDLDMAHPVKVLLEMGWGEAEKLTDWHVNLCVEHGTLLDVEPRLRGFDIGVPLSDDDNCAFSHIGYPEANRVTLQTRTPRNPTVTSSATQGLALHIQADAQTCITGTINGIDFCVPITELATGARSFYLSGFVSPAFVLQRAIPAAEYQHQFSLLHQGDGSQRDWYYVRVRQKNGHWAWSSPIWVDPRQ